MTAILVQRMFNQTYRNAFSLGLLSAVKLIIRNTCNSKIHSDASSLRAIPHISMTQEGTLIDDKLHIRVNGLNRFQKITLLNKVTDNGIRFSSSGCFVANNEGFVDVSQEECVQGTYRGKDPMGLFWSLKPEPGFEYKRLLKSDVSTPMVFHMLVYDGIHLWEELHQEQFSLEALCTTEINRWYKSPDVKRVEVHEGNLRGALFIPKGTGPFPAIIDMFGGIGGLVETRAALFASRGFLTLALAYFNYKDLSENFYDVHFPYFQEAASWLYCHTLTLPGGIGTVGVSYGAMFAASMATNLKEVAAAVVINSLPHALDPKKKTALVKDSVMHQIIDLSRLRQSEEGSVMKFCYVHHDEYLIKPWESDAKFLCIVGEDDQCVDSSYMENWYSKWPSDKRDNIEFIKYPDTGHLVEPPYTPHHRTTKLLTPFKGLCVWGGKPEGHAYAQEDSWRRILKFLRTNVTAKNKRSIKVSCDA